MIHDYRMDVHTNKAKPARLFPSLRDGAGASSQRSGRPLFSDFGEVSRGSP
ncbi:MAG: hypothetical protein U1E50_10740 [Caulobacteraceae bacterium]